MAEINEIFTFVPGRSPIHEQVLQFVGKESDLSEGISIPNHEHGFPPGHFELGESSMVWCTSQGSLRGHVVSWLGSMVIFVQSEDEELVFYEVPDDAVLNQKEMLSKALDAIPVTVNGVEGKSIPLRNSAFFKSMTTLFTKFLDGAFEPGQVV